MKVLVHIGRMIEVGGAEKAIVHLAQGLASCGIDVVFVSQFRTDGTSCIPLGTEYKVVSLCKGSDTLSFNFLNRFLGFRKVFRDEKPDAVVCFMPLALITASLWVNSRLVPLVYCERDSGIGDSALSTTVKKFIFKAKRIQTATVVQTHGLARHLKFNFALERNVFVIPNVIVAPAIQKNEYHEENLNLVSHGRLIERKRFDVLIQAFSRLVTEFPTLSLKIAGKGECKNELESLVSSLGLDGKVEFVGHLRNCNEFLARGSIGVYLSRSEGFPNALCEALAVGLPVLASDCDFGPSDLIASGTNGILLPKEIESNLDLIVKEIRNLILDAELRKNLGDNAKKVIDTFSEDRNLDLWVDMLQKLVTHKSVR
jgi:GalNAc-alpha-(1->4)-GalNAc-alpha-(1->3)-diNAcBac-PP-undecaprenol alpha-1,4-N-acetyl-D-galactosaminyltransferase